MSNENNTKPTQPQPAEVPLAGTDPIADRRIKLERLRTELGIDPFGSRVEGLISLAAARAQFSAEADAAAKADPQNDQRPKVAVAGRVILHRDIGKLVFMTLRDNTGDLQVAISAKSVDEKSFKLAKLVDLGDIVVTRGPLGTTKTGEITIWSAGEKEKDFGALSMASKSLTPPPEKWHGLSDPEQRYRKRYVDLWANPSVMKTLETRMRIVEEIRAYLRNRGFLEVETPMLQPIHGGAAARPFITHHNALDMKLYMRIAPELYLKRLLVGGFPKIFEVNRNFRNEGISPRHNPEFTMLEAYEAFGSWETMADLVEDMTCTVAQKVLGTLIIEHKRDEASPEAPHANAGPMHRTINLTRPWRRVRMVDLVEERIGIRFEKNHWNQSEAEKIIDYARKRFLGTRKYEDLSPDLQQIYDDISSNIFEDLAELKHAGEQLVYVYEKFIESSLIDPCFVTHVPSVIIPLAKENKDDPFFADVYELAINGQEISPGYSELNDPDTQEKHFRHQVGDREEQQQIDEDFLAALRVGMPPAGGMGLGIDRLVMMLTGAPSIRDVILFPLMRPQA